MPAPSPELATGQLRRRVLLGTEAVYRVCNWDENFVAVEVVSVPGLLPGRRFRLLREAVDRMDVVDAANALDQSLKTWTQAARVRQQGS